jgi:hypothetical protein
MLQKTKNCVCVCVYLCVRLSVCLCVSMHYKIKRCCKRNYGKIILNVTAYISPIRLRNIAGDLAGERVRVSGWDKTSDSKYNILINLYFNFKIAHIRITVSKGKSLMVFRIFCGHCEYLLFILWHAECKYCPKLYGSFIWTSQLVLYIH